MRCVMPSSRNPVFVTFSLLIVTVFFIRLITHEGLALDGSAGILKMMYGEKINFIRGREFEELINNIPVLLLIKSGLASSVQDVSYVIGATIFGIPTML